MCILCNRRIHIPGIVIYNDGRLCWIPVRHQIPDWGALVVRRIRYSDYVDGTQFQNLIMKQLYVAFFQKRAESRIRGIRVVVP